MSMSDTMLSWWTGGMNEEERNELYQNQLAIYERQKSQGLIDSQDQITFETILSDIERAPSVSETFLDVFPREAAAQVRDIIQPLKDEASLFGMTLTYLPKEFARQTGEVFSAGLSPILPSPQKAITDIKWILLAGLGIYAAYLASPAIKKAFRKIK